MDFRKRRRRSVERKTVFSMSRGGVDVFFFVLRQFCDSVLVHVAVEILFVFVFVEMG